jgi:hypothetical protein
MTAERIRRIRQLLWIYFWLLIFEGALRKWFLPFLSGPLLLVRDPIAMLALWWGWPMLSEQQRFWIKPLLIIGIAAFALALTVGHGDIPTAIFGSRVLIFQLPLIFVYAAVFDRRDVLRFAWAFLLLAIPMTVLIATQSSLPDTHFLNVGPGGEGTAAYQGAMGRSRPPGTFSFISGVASFYSLALASLFIILYDTRLGFRGRAFCACVGIALVVAVPVSVSRSLLGFYIIDLLAVILALVLSRTKLTSLFMGLVAVALSVGIATSLPVFREASVAFIGRWDTAGRASGADREKVGDLGVASNQIQGRVLPGFTTPFERVDHTPFLGYGIGLGSNFGAKRVTGKVDFLMGEGGWDRDIGELGLLGLLLILWKVGITLWMMQLSLRSSVRGNRLPLILMGVATLPILAGQISQPTALGFTVVSAGLTLAALNPGVRAAVRPPQNIS